MARKNPIPVLRLVAIVEAVSFIVLLLIAMPLKYFAGWPAGVTVVGMLHGVLFVVFLAVWIWTTIAARWSAGRATMVLVSALVPFGPFVIDGRMKAYEREITP